MSNTANSNLRQIVNELKPYAFSSDVQGGKHAAALIHNGKIVYVGVSQKICSATRQTTHAEVAVLERFLASHFKRKVDVQSFLRSQSGRRAILTRKRFDLVVIRCNTQGLQFSEPCRSCAHIIRRFGEMGLLRRIYYTTTIPRLESLESHRNGLTQSCSKAVMGRKSCGLRRLREGEQVLCAF